MNKEKRNKIIEIIINAVGAIVALLFGINC